MRREHGEQSVLSEPVYVLADRGAAYADGAWWSGLGILTGANVINEGNLHQQKQCIPFIEINKPADG